MATTELSSSVLAELRKYDTPTICNLLELFEVMPRTAGYMDARIQACYPKLPPMVGYAATATFRAAAPPRSGDIYAGLAKQVEILAAMAGPKVVVFQDLDDPPVAATFGEVMCTTYQAFECVGLIRLPRSSKIRPERIAGDPFARIRRSMVFAASFACTASNRPRSTIGSCSPR